MRTAEPIHNRRQALRALVTSAALSGFPALILAAEPVYPLKVSGNRRGFVDQNGDPVFWLGSTQWQLFREYKIEDAETIIEKGGLVTVMAHMYNPANPQGGGLRDKGVDLADLLKPGTDTHTRWMQQLDLMADGLKELKDAGVVVRLPAVHRGP